ncbi:MOSC domain-containing protein [Marinobacter sp. F3R08]|uniref:MOSC domain-containing protein n=1 Tax=Marinobacter sp. F3R08 TaxID=2841559 RepID=UPI001C09AD85|nr:MOSC N-terminal beta barrel domain-containing protein [Marinobacter sp. F3R08]MBU2952546.1 MOSC domain-containing protein [Marinobacter sp. F3R08]
MKVHSLFVYPVKSLSGIEVADFKTDDFGPVGDRRWMIVDDERRFVTQREHPELARIVTRLEGEQVTVNIPGEGEFSLTASSEELRVLVWRDWVQTLVGLPEASDALSRFCGIPVRFVFMPDSSFRRVDASRVDEYRRVGFADGFPFLVTNVASLKELNTRLDVPVEMRRFRPNIVVEGAGPWEEDHWQSLQIGHNDLSIVKPCSRCVMTTVDPSTGQKDAALQPLRTLSSYRRTQDGVIFGQNALHESPGIIRVGDPVIVNKSE